MATLSPSDEQFFNERFNPIYTIVPTKPVIVNQDNDYDRCVFTERPLCGPLLFANNASDARDHCANERSTSSSSPFGIVKLLTLVILSPAAAFLSWLRLAVYMAIVSVAIVISFHLKAQPSDLERRMALPFGIVFWLLSIACLASGLATYIQTVTRYSRRSALVQSGWKTQLVFTVVATAIVAACILFLSTNAKSNR